MKSEVTKEMIDSFLEGSNPQERIVKIECGYEESKVHILYRDKDGNMRMEDDNFYPFVWCKLSACLGLYNGNRTLLKNKMNEYGIRVKLLRTSNTDGHVPERMDNGFKFMFYAVIPMSYIRFLNFFEEGGKPIYSNKRDNGIQEYVVVSNTEQYMIYTGKRMFKGFNDYDDLLRMTWDLETEGLDPRVNAISQIGIRTNRGFEKIITIEGATPEEKRKNEVAAMEEAFQTMHDINPDVICGHNTENFDWNFFDVRLQVILGIGLREFTKRWFNGIGIYKRTKQAVLKLGGEMEYYYPTVWWGHNITDSLHAVRRAQALDSNMKKADLKYVAAYSTIKKPNRVYIPGKIIDETWLNLNKIFAFNDKNGHWFKTNEETLNKTYTDENGNKCPRYTFNGYDQPLIDNQNKETFEFVTGRYIAERYLMDDLWEGDRVEHRYNSTNFLVNQLIPISFEKCCTTGTAALWKYILMAWSYEHGLALPDFTPTKSFTGGLSRLLSVGYSDHVLKYDFNSLYPSIILTYGIHTDIDIMGAMSSMLEYVLTQREFYKGEKKKYGKLAKKYAEEINNFDENSDEYAKVKDDLTKCKSLENSNDKKQLVLKVLGNSYFGAFGSGSSSGFNWSDIDAAEKVTCCGRQSLRLMIQYFSRLGYKPLVGDSFSGDTPIFIKYNENNLIDIKPIKDLISEEDINLDALGREYDYSAKDYKVLCRSGWVEPSYVYRHKANKSVYRVSDETVCVDVTEDHSLYDADKKKISPRNISTNTKLEYYNSSDLYTDFNTIQNCESEIDFLNGTIENKKFYLNTLSTISNASKCELAKINFLKKCILADKGIC